MDKVERYDVILLGTGFTECILANLLSMDGKKVLIIDRERFSGGANGSIAEFESLQEKFSVSLPEKEGEWNVDLIPKIFLGKDKMNRVLDYIGVDIDHEPVQSASILQNGVLVTVPSINQHIDISKIPVQDKAAYKKLFSLSNQITSSEKSLEEEKAEKYLDSLKLTSNTKELLLHGMLNDLRGKTARDMLTTLGQFCKNQKFKSTSLSYSIYGSGEIINKLLKKFSAKGGRLMLNRPIKKVCNTEGMVVVEAKGLKAMSKFVIGEAGYFDSVKENMQKVVRAICVVDHEVVTPVGRCRSCFITIPGREVEKRHDTYVLSLGSDHYVAPDGVFVVHASTILESENPEAEIKKALSFLGDIKAVYVSVTELYNNVYGDAEKTLKTSSYSHTMSWDDVIDDAMILYKHVTGRILDF